MEGSAEMFHVVTDDGRRLALHRRPPTATPRNHAVVCCHGLGSNHVGFDVHPEMSLARHLAGRGYEVVSVDLRGHGQSERPPWGWCFDDYLLHDVPAAIAAVGGGRPVHWIGHSMGGLLGLAHLGRGAPGIRSLVTVGSSLDYTTSASGFRGLLPFRELLARLPAVPIGMLARLSARFVGRWSTPYEKFNVWPSNCDPTLWRRICETGFHAVSPPVMAQLASAFDDGGLTSRDGAIRYLQRLADSDTPVLMLAGDRDAQCPPEAAERTASVLRCGELRIFGPDHGQADHYGHFDLLMGKRVHAEVFPILEKWLAAQDAPESRRLMADS
jgi:pimeloyl-ACP methyl ester carboxylesterase